jgi:hypothetical protein
LVLCACAAVISAARKTWEEGADSYRGSDGPLTTRWSRYPDPLSGAYVDASIASGFPATDDYNGWVIFSQDRQVNFSRIV